MRGEIDNREIHDQNWDGWLDMKVHGPASRWLRALVGDALRAVPATAAVESILDLGCGEGTMTAMLAERRPAARVTGVDFSAAGIAAASRRYRRSNLSFHHDPDGAALGEHYDLVAAFEVLEHVAEWQELLGRMAEAARSFLLLSFPTGRMRSFETRMGHLRNFRRGEVEGFLGGCGYVAAHLAYAGFPFFSPLYREACNLTAAGSSSFTRGSYGPAQRAVASVLFAAFRGLSTQRRGGDQFCGLFVRQVAG